MSLVGCKALRVLVPFATSHLCEAGFSAVAVIKSKNCNKIDIERDMVGSVVEWLKHQTDDQHGLGSKPTCTILLCPWERHFTALSPAWWSWKAVLNYSNISTKLLADSTILASPEAGRGNCLPYV